MRSATLSGIVLATVVSATPAWAEPAAPQPASTSVTPWVAAGLTMAALPVGGAIPMAVGRTSAFGTTAIGLPLVSAGHLYVGEPWRGAAFAGGGALLYLATAAAYLWEYGGRSFPGPEASRPHEEAVDRYVTAFYVGSSVLTALAAWDAYRLAEEKNRDPK